MSSNNNTGYKMAPFTINTSKSIDAIKKYMKQASPIYYSTSSSATIYLLSREQREFLEKIIQPLQKAVLDSTDIGTDWFVHLQFYSHPYKGAQRIQRTINLTLLKRVCNNKTYSIAEREILNGYRDTFRRLQTDEAWFITGVSIQ